MGSEMCIRDRSSTSLLYCEADEVIFGALFAILVSVDVIVEPLAIADILFRLTPMLLLLCIIAFSISVLVSAVTLVFESLEHAPKSTVHVSIRGLIVLVAAVFIKKSPFNVDDYMLLSNIRKR